MASNMAKWQTRQGELKADLAQTSKLPAATQTSAGVNAIPIGIKQPGASSSVHSPLHCHKFPLIQDLVDAFIRYTMLSRLLPSLQKRTLYQLQGSIIVISARWLASSANGNSRPWTFWEDIAMHRIFTRLASNFTRQTLRTLSAE
jgi:hypothetical protein